VDRLEWGGGGGDEVAHPACQLFIVVKQRKAHLTASTGGLGGIFILAIQFDR